MHLSLASDPDSMRVSWVTGSASRSPAVRFREVAAPDWQVRCLGSRPGVVDVPAGSGVGGGGCASVCVESRQAGLKQIEFYVLKVPCCWVVPPSCCLCYVSSHQARPVGLAKLGCPVFMPRNDLTHHDARVDRSLKRSRSRACIIASQEVAAETSSYAREDMCGPPANSKGFHDPGLLHTAVLSELTPGHPYE